MGGPPCRKVLEPGPERRATGWRFRRPRSSDQSGGFARLAGRAPARVPAPRPALLELERLRVNRVLPQHQRHLLPGLYQVAERLERARELDAGGVEVGMKGKCQS